MPPEVDVANRVTHLGDNPEDDTRHVQISQSAWKILLRFPHGYGRASFSARPFAQARIAVQSRMSLTGIFFRPGTRE